MNGPTDSEIATLKAFFPAGHYVEAEQMARALTQKWPGHEIGWKALAIVLGADHRYAEVLPVLQKICEISPSDLETHNNLGSTFRALGSFSDAEAHFRRALQLKPDAYDVFNNLGELLKDLGRFREAENCFRQALALKPDYSAAHSNLLFMMSYCGMATGERYLAEARTWELAAIPEAVRSAAREKNFSYLPREGRRLRVGYVSGDFRAHPVSYFMERVLQCHDRGRIEAFAYSATARQDAVTARIRGNVEHWQSISGISDDDATDLITRHRIDVLVDLSGHTAQNRLGVFARRAAPVQCHYLGYFASTGLTEMDYWIGDPVVTPQSDSGRYCETIHRLPRVWVCYAEQSAAPDPVPPSTPDREPCLGSFNNLAKITPSTIDLWAKALRRVPEAKLVLKTKELDDSGNQQRILGLFGARGIPAARISLIGRTMDWNAHMFEYNRLDIALDPVGGLTGGTTTCDALWMGVPVVTLADGGHAGRMTASMLAAIGHNEWAAADEDGYVEAVARLAADPGRRRELRATLRNTVKQSPLCDAKGLANSLENAYEEMFDRWFLRRPGGASHPRG